MYALDVAFLRYMLIKLSFASVYVFIFLLKNRLLFGITKEKFLQKTVFTKLGIHENDKVEL